MDNLDFSKIPFDLIINILNIVVLFVILRLLVYKPVRKFMDARNSKLNAQAQDAEVKLNEAKELRTKYEQLLSDTEKQSSQMLTQAREDADKQARDIVESARKKADKMLAEAQERIAVREDEAKLQIQEDVIDLSLSIAEKLLERNITDEDNIRLAKQFFEAEMHNNSR